MAGMTDKLLTTGQVAAELGVTRGTILKWMKAGIVTAESETAGGQQRWELATVQRQISEHRAKRAADRAAKHGGGAQAVEPGPAPAPGPPAGPDGKIPNPFASLPPRRARSRGKPAS
jgi:hypothetical protein